jgi:hypothetical protein
VTITLGDSGGYVRDFMGIFFEGQQFDSVTASGSAPAIRTYTVTVTDGQLTLLLDDLGGDPLVTINGLVLREVISATAMQIPTVLSGEGGSESRDLPLESRHSFPPVLSSGMVLSNPSRSPARSRQEPEIWARSMDVPKKPIAQFNGYANYEDALEESPLIDRVFSTTWPILLDELEQLSNVRLGPSN